MAESTVPSFPATTNETRAVGKASYFRPLRNRDFRLLVTGQTTSTLGDFLFIVAFPFLLLNGRAGLGGLGLALTLLGATRIAGTLLGGMVADRLEPRTVMIMTDATRVVVLGALAYLLAAGSPRLWQFAVAATVIGLLEGLFLPAYRAITPAVLPEAELAAGNSAGEALNTVAAIAGQLIAGAAFALLGGSAVIGIDAATFAVSTITLLAMRSRQRAQAGRCHPAGGAGARQVPRVRPALAAVPHDHGDDRNGEHHRRRAVRHRASRPGRPQVRLGP